MIVRQIDMIQFMGKVAGKKNICCFGAGAALTRFLTDFQEYHIENDIKFIVDNSMEKQGTMMLCNGKYIQVVSLLQMLAAITPEDIILITTAKFPEILEQLNKQKELDNMECYLHTLLRIEKYDCDRLRIDVPNKLSIYQEQKIPKVIHYCWFGKKEMPSQYRKWMESWKIYCPDYEIIEWNEENYDVYKNEYLRQAYESGKWAFVSDYARIDIVHQYGGVYLDTDVELLKNIDELLMNDGFCGFETSEYVAYGLGFGAKKKSTILGAIKEYYDNINFEFKNGNLKDIVCPKIQTEVMKRYGLVCNGEYQVLEEMTEYPSRVLCGMSPYSLKVQCDSTTFAIHHFAASWVDDVQRNARQAIISYLKQ